MTPTPEITMRVLLKRAAKAPADDLPKIIAAIQELHKLLAPTAPSADLGALVKRVEALESSLFSHNTADARAARFR